MTYKIRFEFDGYDTEDTILINAPEVLDTLNLYDYIDPEISKKLTLISISDNREDYRLNSQEIDEQDSAWGYHKGVPEEEFDEELDAEGYYDDYYDEPRYSGYMTELDYEVRLRYKDTEFLVEFSGDPDMDDKSLIDYAKEYLLDSIVIIDVDTV